VIYTESISIHFLAQSRQNGADIHWWRRATSASCQAAAIFGGDLRRPGPESERLPGPNPLSPGPCFYSVP